MQKKPITMNLILKKLSLVIVSLFFLLFLNSCKISMSGGMSRVQEYYKGNDEMLYFVRPLKYKSSKSTLKMDYTYIDTKATKEKEQKVVCAFSIFEDFAIRKIKSITLKTGENESTFNTFEYYFIEKKKKQWESRYAFEMPFSTFEKLMLSDKNHSISITYAQSKSKLHTKDYIVKENWNKVSTDVQNQLLFVRELSE